jgi:hypothetical protein
MRRTQEGCASWGRIARWQAWQRVVGVQRGHSSPDKGESTVSVKWGIGWVAESGKSRKRQKEKLDILEMFYKLVL